MSIGARKPVLPVIVVCAVLVGLLVWACVPAFAAPAEAPETLAPEAVTSSSAVLVFWTRKPACSPLRVALTSFLIVLALFVGVAALRLNRRVCILGSKRNLFLNRCLVCCPARNILFVW